MDTLCVLKFFPSRRVLGRVTKNGHSVPSASEFKRLRCHGGTTRQYAPRYAAARVLYIRVNICCGATPTLLSRCSTEYGQG
jgi:hypothetical protein